MSALSLWALVAIVAVYAALCLLLYGSQRKMIYYPTAEVDAAAASFELSSGGETLKIWQLGADGGAKDAEALLYFGGNAEDVAWNIPGFATRFPNHAIYLANYRGYGGSSGAPSEAGLVQDALALYDHAAARHRTVVIIGRSLGSGVAVQVAAQREVRKLALVTPFDSVLALAKQTFPVFPVALMLKDRYDSAARVADIKAPALIIIAGKDRVIPRRRSDALIAAFPEAQRSVTVIEDANHGNIDDAAGYLDALGEFFND